MDVKQVFDSLARQEQPPAAVDVNRAVMEGRAMRGRRRAAVAGVTAALAAGAVLVAGTVRPWPGRQDGGTVAVPAAPVTSAAARPSAAATPRPAHEGFAELKQKHPPLGRVASVPPLLMWVSDAPRKNGLILCESGPHGSACAGFPPLAADEFARRQGGLRGVEVWFGVAKDDVRAVTAVTGDGRRYPGELARGVGAGLALWAVEYPRGADVRSLVVTGAGGTVLQRITF
ncbi:hypothetical protein GCM10010466_24460 [Planomonospora alba]|uniref:Uncharacterized protein n=1 Tax=Planomonospora alba TaxID=161354 RepID=A0ABP6N1Q7_9ACTN